MISEGFCQCGCGGKTSIAKFDNKKYGWIKGNPKRFIHHHYLKSEEGREKMREGKIGNRNPNWKGGLASKSAGRGRARRIYASK